MLFIISGLPLSPCLHRCSGTSASHVRRLLDDALGTELHCHCHDHQPHGKGQSKWWSDGQILWERCRGEWKLWELANLWSCERKRLQRVGLNGSYGDETSRGGRQWEKRIGIKAVVVIHEMYGGYDMKYEEEDYIHSYFKSVYKSWMKLYGYSCLFT